MNMKDVTERQTDKDKKKLRKIARKKLRETKAKARHLNKSSVVLFPFRFLFQTKMLSA
jgi:hypothetical protein